MAVDDLTFPHGTDKQNFAALDLLRGVAAVGVVFSHLNHARLIRFQGGDLAVDLFFVLSGFVIAHAYEAKLRYDMSFAQFVQIRITRLYPTYLLGTLAGITGAILFSVSHIDWTRFFASAFFALLFLPTPQDLAFRGYHLYPFNFPAWSLCWELAINFFYALMARRLSRPVLLAMVALGLVTLVAARWYYGDLRGGSLFTNMWAGPMRVIYSFFAGLYLYRLWLSGRLRWLKINALLAATILVIILAIRPDTAGLYSFPIIVVIFPALVLGASYSDVGGLKTICAFFGNLSYPLYVIHAAFLPLEGPFKKYIGDSLATLGVPAELPFVLAIIAAACVVERLYDRPLRRWLRHWSK